MRVMLKLRESKGVLVVWGVQVIAFPLFEFLVVRHAVFDHGGPRFGEVDIFPRETRWAK